MLTRIFAATAVGALLLGLAAPTRAWTTSTHREFLTFSAPFALPGLVLAAGTYVFEVPNMSISEGLVRVTGRDGKEVYLTQYTRAINRPDTDSLAHVTFKESAPGDARPVNAWFPTGEDSGRQFIYK